MNERIHRKQLEKRNNTENIRTRIGRLAWYGIVLQEMALHTCFHSISVRSEQVFTILYLWLKSYNSISSTVTPSPREHTHSIQLENL